MTERQLKLGVAGLGRAFMVMLPTFARDPRAVPVAAFDPRPEARRQFTADFNGRAYESFEALCDDPAVEAVYIASPHQFHRAQVLAAAARGKHILLEKPMALTLVECEEMIAACRRAGVQLIVGHCHSFDRPYLHARGLIESGTFGGVRMINALNFTDFLYRPRRPEELVTAAGGGVVFSQGAHQVDIVRLLGGGKVKTVRAATGRWDKTRPTEGAYSALLTFEDGAFASLTYSGYAHFDSDELCGWMGELGQPKDAKNYGASRRALKATASHEQEMALKNARSYGGGGGSTLEAARATAPRGYNQFGFVIASCERADLRPLPHGVMIFADEAQRLDALPTPTAARAEVIDELYDAVVHGKKPLHSGEWGLATLEVCLALLRSADEGREITLAHQFPVTTS